MKENVLMYKNEKRSTLFSISRLNNNGNKVRSMYKMYQTIKYKQTNINKNKQKHFQHFYLPIQQKYHWHMTSIQKHYSVIFKHSFIFHENLQ